MAIIDAHVHIVGNGSGGTGCWIRPSLWRWPLQALMVRHIGLPLSSLSGDLDRLYVEKLLEWVRGSSLDSIVILAQEEVYDEHGNLLKDRGTDGDGNRVKEVAGATTTCFLVDDQNPTGYAQVLEESSTLNGLPEIMYSYGLDLICQNRKVNGSWVVSYYGYDGNGNTRFLTDVNGAISDRYLYDAFGNLIYSQGNVTPNKYLYAGEQWDANVGNLYYLRGRYYDPISGRFWTMDGFEGIESDPRSLNGYAYCRTDPINETDPSGHSPTLEVTGTSFLQSGLTAYHSVRMILPGHVAVRGTMIWAWAAGVIGGTIQTLVNAQWNANDVRKRAELIEAELRATETSFLQLQDRLNRKSGCAVIQISKTRWKEIADHDESSQIATGFFTLHVGPRSPLLSEAFSALNRKLAKRNYNGPHVPDTHLHEYPYASTFEGGPNAIMKPVNPGLNSGHGAYLANQYRALNLKMGDCIDVQIVP